VQPEDAGPLVLIRVPGIPAHPKVKRWRFQLAMLIPLCGILGCKSYSPSQYVSPRVTGRVVDAESGLPLKDVKVRRRASDNDTKSLDPVKGGQAIAKPPAARTGSDGCFVLASERDFAFLRRSGWYSISVSFDHYAYEPLTLTYTLANATNSADGESVVPAGEIRLIPLAK